MSGSVKQHDPHEQSSASDHHGDEVFGLVDFGSTFTKFIAVTCNGRLIGSSQYATVHSNLLEGLDAAQHQVAGRHPTVTFDSTLACSSAGGGLRMAVIGLERDLTTEAARQAALSAGARVTAVVSGGISDPAGVYNLLVQDPDIILLVGGTDGGDESTLQQTARTLAAADGHRVPVVLAGNARAQPAAARALAAGGWTVTSAPNVMPSVGTIRPGGVRETVRRLFISHVIGGKFSGSGERLSQLVHMATPDAVLRGTELLTKLLAARARCTGVIVVDVGGATTDVHSALTRIHEPRGYKPPLLPQPISARSVEADLGVRWNATGIVEAATAERLLDRNQASALAAPAAAREGDPTFLADTESDAAVDRQLTKLAVTVALRRHAGRQRLTLAHGGTTLEHDGRDLTEATLILGTGGALQELSGEDLENCLAAAGGDQARLLPRRATGAIDRRYVLAAAGLLAIRSEEAAGALLESSLPSLFEPAKRDA